MDSPLHGFAFTWIRLYMDSPLCEGDLTDEPDTDENLHSCNLLTLKVRDGSIFC